MENASKALLIAGAMLIAILLMTLLTYLFSIMAENASKIYQEYENKKIAQFNQQFLNYQGRGIVRGDPLTVQEVATLINLAQNNNEDPKFATTVAIYKDSISPTNDLSSQDYKSWLEGNINSTDKYDCVDVHINEQTLVVDYVIIKLHT